MTDDDDSDLDEILDGFSFFTNSPIWLVVMSLVVAALVIAFLGD